MSRYFVAYLGCERVDSSESNKEGWTFAASSFWSNIKSKHLWFGKVGIVLGVSKHSQKIGMYFTWAYIRRLLSFCLRF